MRGMAYLVESQEQYDRLVSCKTEKYEVKTCGIEFLDVDKQDLNPTIADTFVWEGEVGELRDGVFCLEEWLGKEKGEG